MKQLEQGFHAWLGGKAYLDNRGNYRLRAPGSPIAPWDTAVKDRYPEVRDFDDAARAWDEALKQIRLY